MNIIYLNYNMLHIRCSSKHAMQNLPPERLRLNAFENLPKILPEHTQSNKKSLTPLNQSILILRNSNPSRRKPPHLIQRRNPPPLIGITPQTNHPPIHPRPFPLLPSIPPHANIPPTIPRPTPQPQLPTAKFRSLGEAFILARALDAEVGDGTIEDDFTRAGFSAGDGEVCSSCVVGGGAYGGEG